MPDTTKQMKATGRDTPWKVQHIGDSLEIIDALRDTVLTLDASQENAALAAFIVSAVNAQSNTRAALEEITRLDDNDPAGKAKLIASSALSRASGG